MEYYSLKNYIFQIFSLQHSIICQNNDDSHVITINNTKFDYHACIMIAYKAVFFIFYFLNSHKQRRKNEVFKKVFIAALFDNNTATFQCS